MPPGPRSVGCERLTDPRGQPDPAKPHCGFWCATGPAPMAHRGLGVLWGCGGAQGVAMWWATRLVTGVRPSPRWGRFVTPVTAHGGCEPSHMSGGGPQVPVPITRGGECCCSAVISTTRRCAKRTVHVLQCLLPETNLCLYPTFKDIKR